MIHNPPTAFAASGLLSIFIIGKIRGFRNVLEVAAALAGTIDCVALGLFQALASIEGGAIKAHIVRTLPEVQSLESISSLTVPGVTAIAAVCVIIVVTADIKRKKSGVVPAANEPGDWPPAPNCPR